MKRLTYWLLASSLCLAACSGADTSVPVPRPHAYPRVAVPAQAFRTVSPDSAAGISLQVGSTARVAIDPAHPEAGARWLNITYPELPGAVIYLTVTTVATDAEMAQLLDNRIERMGLNSGGNRSELSELTSAGGWTARMLYTPAGTVTPVQFLATDRAGRRAVSGALYIDALNDPMAADSLAPAIDALRGHIIHTLGAL